jgi:aspartate/methionine/tyrosine aminotransferase
VSNVAQAAALEAVSGDLSAVTMMRDAFARRAVVMHRMLNEIEGVTCLKPEGAFYCYPNLSSLLGRPLGSNGSVATTTLGLADLVLGEAKVAFVPGEAFGTPGYARFSFAMDETDMIEGIRRIAEFAAT